MSLQVDLLQPELGFFDEEADLTNPQTYAAVTGAFGKAHSLPPVAYRSKVFSELENEKIWTRGWVLIGLVQQIPDPGDLLPFTLGFNAIHVRRTPDGRIVARYNRHQHAGCRFVPEQCRTGKQTKCAITSCGYTRDGHVLRAQEDGEDTPEMYKFVGDNPDKLIPIPCETWGPFIFVNLDFEDGPLADTLPEALQQFGEGNDRSLALADHQWMDFNCNWKSLGTAFIETGEMPDDVVQKTSGDLQNAIASMTDRAAMGLGDVSQRVDLNWMFPNLLLACSGPDILVAILQSTGMGDTLARVSLLTTRPQDASDHAAIATPWKAALRSVGARAEAAHDRVVKWGTSSLPETVGKETGIETSPARYAMERFVLRKALTVHELYWSAPIMDARMMQRRGSR